MIFLLLKKLLLKMNLRLLLFVLQKEKDNVIKAFEEMYLYITS